MANSSRAQNQSNEPIQNPEAVEAAKAQVDLANEIATDPQPLVDEEADPIAQSIRSSDSESK